MMKKHFLFLFLVFFLFLPGYCTAAQWRPSQPSPVVSLLSQLQSKETPLQNKVQAALNLVQVGTRFVLPDLRRLAHAESSPPAKMAILAAIKEIEEREKIEKVRVESFRQEIKGSEVTLELLARAGSQGGTMTLSISPLLEEFMKEKIDPATLPQLFPGTAQKTYRVEPYEAKSIRATFRISRDKESFSGGVRLLDRPNYIQEGDGNVIEVGIKIGRGTL